MPPTVLVSSATLELILAFSVKYGIPATISIVELFAQKDPTIDDVKKAFSLAHKTYEEYENLPEGSAVPKLPVT